MPRLCQVSVAAVSMSASLIADNAAVRRVERQGLILDGGELEERRKATATKLKNMLVRLGPTFIKGQRVGWGIRGRVEGPCFLFFLEGEVCEDTVGLDSTTNVSLFALSCFVFNFCNFLPTSQFFPTLSCTHVTLP